MGRHSIGQEWEDLNRKQQNAGERELKAQRAAANRAVADQCRDLFNSTSEIATFPDIEPQCFQGSKLGSQRRHTEPSELEAQGSSPPQYRQQAPLTPWTYDSETPGVGGNEQIKYLKEEIIRKEFEIKRLEAGVESEQANRLHLQAERHKAIEAQRRADDEIQKLRNKVANLDQLLDGSMKKEKELESELDLSREEVRELKRRLHDERYGFENDIRAQERWGREVTHQLQDTKSALESEIRRNEHLDRVARSNLESEEQRKHSVQRDMLVAKDKLTYFQQMYHVRLESENTNVG